MRAPGWRLWLSVCCRNLGSVPHDPEITCPECNVTLHHQHPKNDRNIHKSRGLSNQSSLVLSVGSLFFRTPGSYNGQQQREQSRDECCPQPHLLQGSRVQSFLPRAWIASKCAFWEEKKGQGEWVIPTRVAWLTRPAPGCLLLESPGNVNLPKPARGTVHPCWHHQAR